MKRKKIFKILSATVCLIIISALFLVPVSAANHDDFIVSKVMYAERNVDFSVYTSEYSSEDTSLVRWYQPTGGYEGYVFVFNFSSNFVKGDVLNLTGSFLLSDNATSIVFVLENLQSYSLTSDRVLKTIDGVTYYTVDFNITHTFANNGTHTGRFVIYYSNSGLFVPLLGVKDLNCYINNDPQVAMKEQTDELKANQDKNTDKVLNGGHSSAPYGSTDKSSLEQNDKLSSDVDSATLEARSSTISFFNNFSSLITSSGGLHRGLLAISKVFNEFFSISWLINIVKFGLAIGSFAFVIGSVSMIVGRVSSDKSSTQRKTNYDRNVSRRK